MMERIGLEKDLETGNTVSSPLSLRELVINFMAKHSLYLRKRSETASRGADKERRQRRNTCHCTSQ